MIAAVLIWLATAVWFAWLGRAGLLAARIYQIEEYETPRLFAWGRQRAWLWSNPALVATAVALVVGLLALASPPGARRLGVGIGWLVGSAALHILWKPLPAKKALVYTSRMRRILGASAILGVLMAVGVAALALAAPVPFAAVVAALACLLAPALTLALVVGGNSSMRPVEAWIQRGFLTRARARVTAYQPLTIGIAGSYGKTSTKHILAHLLSPHMLTLATPKSYNTLMGISRTINEYLDPKHRAFIVEMDAYATGEIAAMCQLVSPTLAVITSVGPQHLERFGSVARIGDAIYELAAALPPGGPLVIYGGEREAARLAQRAVEQGYRVVRYGMDGESAGALDVVATDVTVDGHGTHFLWRWAAEGLEQRMSIPLLGQHNILNVSAGLVVMHLLGLPLAEAARDARRLEPVEHRLQLIATPGGITIIDDAYNANPVGVHNALEVLAGMPGTARILVTPGLVELGDIEEEENRRFGEHAGRVCDAVILVGARRTTAIAAGLRASGLADDHIHVVQTLAEATAVLARIAHPGDVVLFANDLPDTYVEMG
ncbi:MAG: UDP-N-acetylmuramoyl-tripeptide--D-alanyl-D-alanine ligase [Ktedonobacterales bacterium]|nr:UDP-N-acetylmuramoyl-tripeptide--D-alanyl-D-alanine ligase [Ktedonobacterales bacterium]